MLHPEKASSCHSPAERITLRMVNMQRQNGGVDCGLFAVSTAVSLCHGEDPAAHVKEQSQMREHFICCLESRDMVVFPDSDKPVRTKQRIKSECAVSVHCKCRLPWKKTSKTRSMAECSKCKRWYVTIVCSHITCITHICVYHAVYNVCIKSHLLS